MLEEFAKKFQYLVNPKRLNKFSINIWTISSPAKLVFIELPEIFTQFNSSNTDEEKIHKLVDVIANGLLSTIVSMDIIPVIRAQQNGPAEFVAQQLDLKLREYLSNTRGSTVATASIQQRPVLILLDRNFDLASMFSHSWIYQCMVSDVFNCKETQLKLPSTQQKMEKRTQRKIMMLIPKISFGTSTLSSHSLTRLKALMLN